MIQTVRNAHSHLLTQAESLHTNRGVMERAGHKTGEREREREMAGSKYTPANSSKMCLQMRKSSEPSNNSDTFFISSLRDASIQTIRKIKKKKEKVRALPSQPRILLISFFPPCLVFLDPSSWPQRAGALALECKCHSRRKTVEGKHCQSHGCLLFLCFHCSAFFYFFEAFSY